MRIAETKALPKLQDDSNKHKVKGHALKSLSDDPYCKKKNNNNKYSLHCFSQKTTRFHLLPQKQFPTCK